MTTNTLKPKAPALSQNQTDQQKWIDRIGWLASTMCIVMYVSYLAQIFNNLNGMKGSWIQPLAAIVNCILWTVYGLKTKPRQMQLVYANVPGILLAFITLLTSF